MKKFYEGHGYELKIFEVRSIQINFEPTKASLLSYSVLPPDLKDFRSKLNMRN